MNIQSITTQGSIVTLTLAACTFGMMTFCKLFFLVLLVAVAAHLFPILLFPFAAIGPAILLVGGLIAGVLGLVGAAVLGMLGVVLGLTLALATLLSPIWMPVLVIAAVVAGLRHRSQPAA